MIKDSKNNSTRILFMGASGSGTTTLGKLLSKKTGIPHFDLDDFFWKQTKIPYTEFRNKDELLSLIKKNLYDKASWIISGDPSEWGVGIEEQLTQIYFLACPAEIRVKRLNEREFKKQGEKILKGGVNFANHENFIAWTKKYDIGGISGRSRQKQEKWIEGLSCEVYRFKTNQPIEALIQAIIKNVESRKLNSEK